jgi:hypothetical protein
MLSIGENEPGRLNSSVVPSASPNCQAQKCARNREAVVIIAST